MINILYVLNNEFRHGGTEAVVLNYYHALDREKIHIDFMVHALEEECTDNQVHKELIGAGSKIYYVTPRKYGIKKNREDIKNVLSNERYDVIHTHTDCVGAPILEIAKKCGIGIRIAHSHSTGVMVEVRNLKSFLHWFYLQCCRFSIRKKATHYMACGRKAGEWLFGKRRCEEGKVYFLNNAIDSHKFCYSEEKRKLLRKQLNIEDQFVIGHVGRFSPEKNHKFLIDVFEEVYHTNPKARLLLVGEGELRTVIEEKAAEKNLEQAVIFYGVSDQVENFAQAMDIFLLPSLREALGVSAIEAQVAGLPCIISDRELVSKESAITNLVKYLPLNNAKAWVEEILKTNELQRQDMSRKIEEAGYDLQSEAKKLESYYLSLVKNRK